MPCTKSKFNNFLLDNNKFEDAECFIYLSSEINIDNISPEICGKTMLANGW